MEMKDLLLWQKFLLVGRLYLEILVSNTKLPANNHHIASFVSPLVFSKGSVQISPRWISGSVSVDFSRCENWFLPGNSKVPAKSCSGHHYRLICQAKYTFVFCLCQAHLSLFFFPALNKCLNSNGALPRAEDYHHLSEMLFDCLGLVMGTYRIIPRPWEVL